MSRDRIFKRSLMRSVVVIGSLMLVSLQARAQGTSAEPDFLADDPSERDHEARTEFEKGRQAYDEGKYRDAWGFFHNAYKLSGRPELLYNIGQTADRLRMDADAIKAFRLYVERLPDAANRREVENRVRALEERMKESGDAPPPPSTTAPPAAPTGDVIVGGDDAPQAPAAPAPPTNGQPKRDGWYFRGALGLGVRSDSIGDDATLDASLSGAGLAGEFAVGITVLPGLVVGGGLFFDWTSSPSAEANVAGNIDLGTANLTMLGPMVDWYLRRETDGWHLQGALALASLNIGRGSGVASGPSLSADTATGASLLLGGGYEWPIDAEWAIGALGRLTFASVATEHYSHGFFAASALCSVTWY